MSCNVLLYLQDCPIIPKWLGTVSFRPNSPTRKTLAHPCLEPAHHRFDSVFAMKNDEMQVPRFDRHITQSIPKLGARCHQGVE
jgi:hypothetical protein